MKSEGVILNKQLLSQTPIYQPLRFEIENEPFRGVQSPTDIDLYFEYQNQVAIVGEFKRIGNNIPRGQEITLTRMVNGLSHVYNGVYLIEAHHSTPSTEQYYDAFKTLVSRVYFKGKWHSIKRKTEFGEVYFSILEKHEIPYLRLDE